MTAKPTEPTRVRARMKLAWVVAFMLGGVVLCEIMARVFDWAPVPVFETDGGLLGEVNDPIQRYENRPGARERVRYFDTPDGSPRVVRQAVNAQRFRGPLVEQPKPEGLVRIACLGDSHTFGFGVSQAETWPAQLHARLQNADGDARIEVLNCGVYAYDTLQEVIWLKKRVLPFEPDIVVLQYYINDTAARGMGGNPGGGPTWIFALSHPRREGFVRSLRQHSRVADLVLDGVFRRSQLASYASSREGAYRDDSPGWIRARAALIEARDVLAARGVRFAVALFPFMLRDGEHFTSHAAFEVVKDFCASEGIPCFDTESAFLASGHEQLRVSTSDYHANGLAYGIFAEAVERELRALGWL